MQEKLTFQNSKGENLVGILSNPTGKKDKIAIICHGYFSTKDRPAYVRLEGIFNKYGFATFRFDFSGNGESEGKLKDVTITKEVDELLKAVEFLREKGYSNFSFCGGSFAGEVILLAVQEVEDTLFLALQYPVIDYYGVASGYDDFKEWGEKGYKVRHERDGTINKMPFLVVEDAKKYDGYELCKNIKVPVFIVHGEKDKSVSVEQVIKAQKLLSNCTLHILKGAGHHFEATGQEEEAIVLMEKFIAEHSQP